MKRRGFLVSLAALSVGGLAAVRWGPDGNQWRNPCLAGMPQRLAEHPLITAAWAGVDPIKVRDVHVHIVGTGDSGSGMAVNPAMDSLAHPVLYAQKRIFMNAACAEEPNHVDERYLQRLLQLVAAFPPGVKFMLYAMEHFHAGDGHIDHAHTGIHVPNAFVAKLAEAYPDRFEWVASVHPYRDDAVVMLEKCVKGGAKAVKWLPSAMGIDPADARCDAFYAALLKHKLPLIVHTGTELSVNGDGHERSFNNPLRLRRPLQTGVRVVAAHCASLGRDADLDSPARRSVSSFELFTRLMNEDSGKHLYGDLSATPQLLRMGVLAKLLANEAWHPRLLNGSDYPLPGIFPIYSLKALVRKALLAATEAEVLHELRQYNPLLFDFVLKRSLRWRGKAFPAQCFETADFFAANASTS